VNPGSHVLLRISDTGDGMPPAIRELEIIAKLVNTYHLADAMHRIVGRDLPDQTEEE